MWTEEENPEVWDLLRDLVVGLKLPKQSFSYANEHEKKKKVFQLVLKMQWAAYLQVHSLLKVQSDEISIEEPKHEIDFFPSAASTCKPLDEAVCEEVKNPILTPGLPKPFLVNPLSDDYVPDTCLIADADLINSEKPDFTVIPETQDGFSDPEAAGEKAGPSVTKRKATFDNVCNDFSESFKVNQNTPKMPPVQLQKSEDQLKDEAIREKYEKLPVTAKKCNEDSDQESPSVLTSRLATKRNRTVAAKSSTSDDENIDDFKDSPEETVANVKAKPKKRFKAATNSYGLTVGTPPSDSQVARAHNMKQATIRDIFKGTKKVKRHVDPQEEEDMKKAVAESLKDVKDANDSFDIYEPDDPFKNDENAWELANVRVRNREDRKKLLGFSCKDCEKYYANVQLTDEQMKEIVNKCSRHRSTVPPPPDSPQEMWKLDIEGPDNKTQIGSPLKTRERRKMSRNRANKQ